MSYTENLKFSNINPTKNQNELGCSGKVNNSYSTSETCHVTIVETIILWFTTSELFAWYLFVLLCWPLYCLSFLDLRLPIRSRKSKKDRQHNGQKIPMRQSEVVNQRRTDNTMAKRYQRDNQGHCVVCPSLIYDFWLPLWYLLAIVLSVLLWFTTSDCLFGIFWPLCCLSFLQNIHRRTDNTMVKRQRTNNDLQNAN
jgi:hypothetical protein